MDIKRLTIQLDPMEIPTSSTRSAGFYYPGDTVSGIVSISNRGVSINGLHLQVVGRVTIHNTSDPERVNFMQKSFMNLKFPLIHDCPLNQDVMEDGLKLPFEFTLPREIPSSYKTKWGNIQYSIQAIIEKQNKASSHQVIKYQVINNKLAPPTVNPTVKAEVTLNYQDYVPVRQSVSIPRTGNWEELKRISADVWLDRTGYVPGETIEFNAMIDNKSGKYVRGTTVQLIQYTTFNDGQNHDSDKEKTILWETKGRQISDNATQLWDKFPIIVPCVPPSRMPFVDITYVIKLTVHRTGFLNSNLVVRQNIVIASYHSLSYRLSRFISDI